MLDSELLNRIIVENQVKLRLSIKPTLEMTNWSNWVTIPNKNYIEIENFGPIRDEDIEFIEIQLFETKYIGRLVGEKKIDKKSSILKILDSSNIKYQILNDLVRIG